MFKFPAHTFVIAEAGINHNGSVALARQLIDAAADAGADCVKFQKRTPRMCLPAALWDQVRDTPWGLRMTYIEYRERLELDGNAYQTLRDYANHRGLLFSASPWDANAADTLHCLGVPFFKIASASVTNLELIRHVAEMQRPVIMSTGMSSVREIGNALEICRRYNVPEVALLACTSSYPAQIEDLNLERIHTLKREFPGCKIGYSGHEAGLWTTLCAVAMGAEIVERHITLDRTLPGTDQAASVEPQGFKRLVKEIRNFEKARGSGQIRLLECERDTVKRLRG